MATRRILDLGSSRRAGRLRLALPAAAVAAAAALAACGTSAPASGGSNASTPASGGSSASASASASAAAVGLKTAKVGGVTVLTSAKDFTLYSFAPDTSTKSVCNGACATQWPPVKATTSAVKAPYATITRADGATQLTFHGRPLYTFLGDTSPGQASGNGLNAFGGLWHVVPASGGAAPAGNSPGSGGGGY